MSIEYDIYLKKHKDGVSRACEWMLANIDPVILRDIFKDLDISTVRFNITKHDDSKYTPEEYGPYDAYFYGGFRTPEIDRNFNLAFMHHCNMNPHHWQHWCLIADDPSYRGEYLINRTSAQVVPFEIPDIYIFEMIADWWSFSWNMALAEKEQGAKYWFDDLYSIFAWYKQHENTIIFADDTRTKVNRILEVLRLALDLERDKKAIEENPDKLELDVNKQS